MQRRCSALPAAVAAAAAAAARFSPFARLAHMPLTVAEGALLGAGMLFAGGATMAYKAKQTRLFKTLYFLSWPTVGAGCCAAVQCAAAAPRHAMLLPLTAGAGWRKQVLRSIIWACVNSSAPGHTMPAYHPCRSWAAPSCGR